MANAQAPVDVEVADIQALVNPQPAQPEQVDNAQQPAENPPQVAGNEVSFSCFPCLFVFSFRFLYSHRQFCMFSAVWAPACLLPS